MLNIKTVQWTSLLVFSLLAGCSGSRTINQQTSPFAGTWDYHVTDPTGEVYTGVISIRDEDNVLTGLISNEALSIEHDFEPANVSDKQLSFFFDAGSYGEILVSVIVQENNMSGSFANETIGEMPLTGLRLSTKAEKETPGITPPRPINTDPEAARVHTIDIENFWEAFDQAGQDFNPEAFQTLYIDKGSEGLKGFMRYRIRNALHLAETVRSNQEYYRSIRDKTLNLPDITPTIREIFHVFKDLYPEAVFPDVFLVIGARNSGGTASDRALIIGVEMYGQSEMKLEHIIAHELIHFQQQYQASSLLEQSIKEGSADFLGKLISGKTANEQLPAYAEPIEDELWNEFKGIMHGDDFNGWLYGDSGIEGRPADLGYWIGYQITEAFYNQAQDKKQAIRDILHISDVAAFLEASGYK